MVDKKFWKNKKVLITGNTGFKGSWLQLSLNLLDANTYGIALKPNKRVNRIFHIFNKNKKNCYFFDITNKKKLSYIINKIQPEIIFHLAAQPYVKKGFDNPYLTYKTNILGTINLFEACKSIKNLKAIINITTDKVYFNNEKKIYFKEDDKICGEDPYSNSKSCSDLITYSYFKSFFEKKSIKLSTVRAGNIIGGGDWGSERLIPDIIRSIYEKKNLTLRSLNSIRPWLSVFFVLKGYLCLGQYLVKNSNVHFTTLNFSPNKNHQKKVSDIVKLLGKNKIKINYTLDNKSFKEKKFLMLSNKNAKSKIGWKPNYVFNEMILETFNWYDIYYKNNSKILLYSKQLIKKYLFR